MPRASMKYLLIALLLIGAASQCCALAESELRAISSLFIEWPVLRNLNPPWTENASSACDNPPFAGISCIFEDEYHVSSLELRGLTLYGSIPEAIGGLYWLETFNLSSVSVSGPIPQSVGNLTRLKTFSLIVLLNELTVLIGGFPPTIGSLVNLETLELEVSAPVAWPPFPFPGGPSRPIPDEIQFCKKLRNFRMSGDGVRASFEGPIPIGFCQLDELRHLDLHNSALNGLDLCSSGWPKLESFKLSYMSIENGAFSLLTQNRPHLRYIDVAFTRLKGTLGLLELPKVETLLMDEVPISGVIPDALWSLTSLRRLVLSGTRLEGTISSQIQHLQNIRYLDLSFQKLSGTIPPEIGLCTSLREITMIRTQLTGTIPEEIANLRNLSVLNLATNQMYGSLPASLSQLTELTTLALIDSQLTSTIPASWASMTKLGDLFLNLNRLSGTIPPLPASLWRLNLANNFLEGEIPEGILKKALLVDLSQNRLSGALSSVLASNSMINYLDVSSNRLNGSLPTFLPRPTSVYRLSFSHNDFSGVIPPQYMELAIQSLEIANNRLEGFFTPLWAPNSQALIFDIRNNQFEGTLHQPTSEDLQKLLISNNRFVGTIPRMPSRLLELDASQNSFQGDITRLLVSSSSLTRLDLSHNLFGGPLPVISKTSLVSLSLAGNQFNGPLYVYGEGFGTQNTLQKVILENLDISSNKLSGVFPKGRIFGQLSTLRISNNEFFGHFPLDNSPKLTVLDLANNQFSFDVSELNSRSYLVSVDLRNNSVYGALSLAAMTSLRSADFSGNQLSLSVDFESIGRLFTQYQLGFLSIVDNPLLPIFGNIYPNRAQLKATTSSSPSANYSGVSCFSMAFGDNKEARFLYDEHLFDYQQCYCDESHYGAPPQSCFHCSMIGTSPGNCSGPNWSTNPHHFVYDATNGQTDPQEVPIGVESCFLSNVEIGVSNCLGLRMECDKKGTKVWPFPDSSAEAPTQDLLEPNLHIIPTPRQLQRQCRIGSSGRLCAKCDCEAASECFFAGSGNRCSKCVTVFRPSTYVPATIALLFVILAVLVVVFFFILKSKRSLKDVKWENLPFIKRCLYRLIYLMSIGQITILVTFVQMLVELTDLNAYALRSWLKLVNGEGGALGLLCVYPFLVNPVSMLIFKLFLPFGVAGFIATAIGLAELSHRLLERWQIRKTQKDHQYVTKDDLPPGEEDEMTESLIQRENRDGISGRSHVAYPASGLLSSISISVIRFFYFGSALSAHEYLFSETQAQTKKLFVQSVPWMPYEEARTLRGVSIPFILLFLFLLPLAFVTLCWKLRHKILSPFVRVYFGSLFENFQPRCYWWELVNISRKLSIALVLRGFGPGNAFQPSFIAFILGTLLIATAIFKPWKSFWVNAFDSIGGLLLMLSMGISHLQLYTHFTAARTFILVLDGLFFASCIGVIAYEMITGETDYEKQWKARFENGGELQVHGKVQYERALLSDPLIVLGDD